MTKAIYEQSPKIALHRDVPESTYGDVVGPSGATDDNIAIFDGSTGKLLADSALAITEVTDFIDSKGDPNGLASLDGTGKVPLAQIPDTLIGGLQYKGVWNCSTGLYPTTTSTGDYYVCNVAGTISGTYYAIGDWLVYNGATWDRVDGGAHPHDWTHISGAVDEIDGDQLDIDFSPIYYTPTVTALSPTTVELTSHLNGIDTALSLKVGITDVIDGGIW